MTNIFLSRYGKADQQQVQSSSTQTLTRQSKYQSASMHTCNRSIEASSLFDSMTSSQHYCSEMVSVVLVVIGEETYIGWRNSQTVPNCHDETAVCRCMVTLLRA